MSELIILINPENASESVVQNWKVRSAARGIILDSEGKMALLHVRRDAYYKLPGGGIEEGESKEDAFKRECVEEIGCTVEVESSLGIVEEWRKIYDLRQFSYCYVGKVMGQKGEPNFEADEIEKGFEVVWVSKEEALDLLKNSDAKSVEGQNYIKQRDVAILEKYLRA